jgi:hypothetical protein
MNQRSPSTTAPRRGWSRTRLAAGTLALTMGTLAVGLAVTALPAYADVTSANYTIGSPTGGVTSVLASPTAVGANSATTFTVTFTTPAALSGSASSWITVTPSVALGLAPSGVDVVATGCIQGGTSGVGGAGSSTTGGVSIYLQSSCSIAAASSVSITFTANAPVTTGTSFYFTVTTSSNSSAATSNAISVGTGVASLTAASHNFGTNTTYSISSVPISGLSTSTTGLALSAITTGGTGAITFSTGTAGYAVTYTPSGGTAASDTVTAVTPTSTSSVTLTLATAIANGGTLNITAIGTNPTTASSNAITVTPSGGTGQTTNSITFGNSVSNVVVTPSSLVAGAATTYTVSFKAASSVGIGGDIFLSETTGPTNFATVTGIAVSDATQNWRFVASGAALASGSATIPLSNAITAGDSLAITLANVTNPGTSQTVSDFNVSTSSDTVASSAAAYTIGANGSAGVVVTPNPSTVGSLSTYTISGLKASAAMTGGSSTLNLVGPSGTVFPANSASYSITDSTTSSGSGTVTAGVSGGGTNNVTVTVPNSINSGDSLTLTILTVINPSVASSSYSIALHGNINGPTPTVAFPGANVTYSNGAIVNFSGTLYVFAGGRAFGIGNSTQLAALQKVDKATTQTAVAGTSAPTGVTPRSGTLVTTRAVTGEATIYVIGTDGELHGFATPKQFGNDGYDGALNVTVTTLGSLKIGATAGAGGAADNALGTSADGAIVNSAGAYYTFAGGRAFDISTGDQLSTIKKTNKATFLKGTVTSAQKSAVIASGVMFTVAGPVYIAYQSQAWPFKTQTQLKNAGYGGTAAVPVPTTGGLTVASY